MKKFTGNFLLDEHSLGGVLRKIGLSMVAILMAVVAFAQPQETYHVWAESADDYCFQRVNEYEVDIYMKDFVKIDTFELILNYDEDVFSYGGLKAGSVHTVLAGGSGLEATKTDDGELTFRWGCVDPVTEGTIGATTAEQNDTTVVFTLKFVIDGVPYSYGPVAPVPFQSDLEWDSDAYGVWDNVGQVTNILTDYTSDGSLTVTQMWDDITLVADSAFCFDGEGSVSVTVPDEDDMTYSFNGTTFTTNPTTDVLNIPDEGKVVNAWVELDGCVSFKKSITVLAPDSLYFTAADTVYVQCDGEDGDIEIEAHGGTPDYTYFVVPDADFGDVTLTLSNWEVELDQYSSSNAVAQAEPGIYWVAGNDAVGCNTNNLVDDWDHASGVWLKVTVLDTVDPLSVVVTLDSVTCYEGEDGMYTLDIAGGTPFDNDVTEEYGYKVWRNGAYLGVIPTDSTLSQDELMAGDIEFYIEDANGCSMETTIEIWQPDPITFMVIDTDASCYDAEVPGSGEFGTIRIDTLSIQGGSGYDAENDTTYLDGYWWVYSTSPNFEEGTTDTVSVADGGVFTTADSLPAGVYYVRVFDAGDCFDDFVNPTGDNAVKLLTTQFDLVYDSIACYEGTTEVTIDIETGTGNHTFLYGLWPFSASTDTTGLTWQASNTFEDIPAGEHTFFVYDVTIGCVLSYTEDVTEPTRLNAFVYDNLTLPPSCPDNTDGNLVIGTTGGTPFVNNGISQYEYKLDDNPWVLPSAYGTFAIDTAPHKIFVRDANGCVDSVQFNWDKDINYIEFVDTIWNQCPMELVNVFNRYPWDDGGDTIGVNYGGIDWGFLTDFEWYGTGMEEFTGAIYSSYWFWTSDSGWFEVVGQGIQQLRNPEFYIVDTEPASEQEVVDNSMGSREDGAVDYTDSWAAGTYWIVAMDEWGCFSNIEKIVIMDPPSLDVTLSTEPAGCDGSTDGKIILEALNGRFDIPETPGYVRYQYVLTQQPQIFGHDNWLTQVTWRPFTDGSFTNDSLGVINVQASEKPYYVAIRDWCATENPDLIWFSDPITITGASAIEVAGDIEDYITNVTCIIDGKDAEYDGSVMGLLAATTGGFGGYTYTLESTWLVDGDLDAIDEENESGDFDELPGGEYILTIVDDSLGCEAVYEFEITQPEPLRFDHVLVNPSCFDAHDGILRYMISGGTAPYWEVTNNTGAWQDAEDITAAQWVETESEGWWAFDVVEDYDSTWVFDRRVRQNEKQIYIKDANGCIWEVANVSVKAPAKLEITKVISNPVSCNDQDELNEGDLKDGSIVFIPKGGWNQKDTVGSETDSLFMYTAKLWKKNSSGVYKAVAGADTTFNVLDTISFEGLGIGDYKITLYEYSDSIANLGWEYPVGTYTNYWSSEEWYDFAPWQNPLVEENDFSDKLCVASYEVSVEEPDPITYDTIHWMDVKCYNTETGSITIENIMGGIPKLDSYFGGYVVGLEGPADFHPMLQPGADSLVYDITYNTPTDSIVWFTTGLGVNDFTFENLTWGHYTVHVADSMGCWIYKESGEIENPDTLEIEVVELVENVLCNGDETGVIQIDATGGVEPYWYAVDPTLMPNPEDARFPDDTDLGYYLDSVLVWQRSDTFEVTAGTWVGYVKDANGCVVGFATRPNGATIWQHRVDVIEPDPVVVEIEGQDSVKCYDGSDGAIEVASVAGGKGGAWVFQVVGTDYLGNVVDTMYEAVDTSMNIVLGGLPASTDKDPKTDTLTPEDYYVVYAYDNADCKSAGDSMYVLQPEEFIITVKSKQDALICYSDQAGLYEVDVLSGGVPFGIGGDGEPIYEMKLEAYTPEGVLIDSLSDDIYAKVKTFNGYAGLNYTIWARDANGCETSVDTFIEQPMPVDFMVEDLTCYGDTLAAALVTITSGNEGRSYQLWYKEILNDAVPATWIKYNGWFEGSIVIDTTFIFDNENLQDRHYAVMVVDTMGCMSGVDTLTFDKVQNELTMEKTVTATEVCPVDVTLKVNGGTGPYTIFVDNVAVEGLSHALSTGTHQIRVEDAHYCFVIDTVEVMGLDRDTLVETYFGEEVMFSDVVAGVADTMLAEGVYTFPYDTEEGCTTVLTVTVEGVPYMLSIMEVQSEADSSEYVGSIVEVDGTVTEVVAGTGFYMQDANAAWGGIYVTTTATTGLQIGNGVVVTGTVDEIAGVTTIVSTEVDLVTPVLTVVPVVVAAGEVADEMYESVLVIVEGGRAMSQDTVTGEWVVLTDAEATVNDLFYAADVVVDHYYDVTGIVNGMEDAYTIEPRDEDDVVDLTATPNNEITSTIEFKVYPNPFNDRIIIDNNDKLTRIVVSNIAGQRVIDIEYPSHEIRTANLVSGVYVISMFTEDGIAKTERIVKR